MRAELKRVKLTDRFVKVATSGDRKSPIFKAACTTILANSNNPAVVKDMATKMNAQFFALPAVKDSRAYLR